MTARNNLIQKDLVLSKIDHPGRINKILNPPLGLPADENEDESDGLQGYKVMN